MDNIIVLSLVAFTVVIVTLWILSVMMRVISTIFPERELQAPRAVDQSVAQAVGMAVSAILPGSTITRIEEIITNKK